jgi:hypothetical protein
MGSFGGIGGVVRLIAESVVVFAGALLLAVAEVARSFSPQYGAGNLAAPGGIALCAIGLVLLVVDLELVPFRRPPAGRGPGP